MRWSIFGVAGVLSFSGALASIDTVLKAESNGDTVAALLLRDATPRANEARNATTPNVFSRFLHHFDTRQAVGRCGADFSGSRCPGSQCCSGYGWCGTDFEHCAPIVGCQPEYGRCGDAVPEPTPTRTPTPTPNPTPTPTPTPTPAPPSSSVVIPPSSSVVAPSSSSVLPPLPSGTLIISPNGQCSNVTTCAGSSFGGCCSNFFYCGTGSAYCGIGCRSAFGTCDGGAPSGSSFVPVPVPSSSSIVPVPSSSSIWTPTPTPIPTPTTTPTPSTPPPPPSSTAPAVPTNVSRNGRCGADGSGTTCQGSTYGRCCSEYGYCGSSEEYCRPTWGCQSQFGTCDG